ncbi:MAG: hypothetical protein JXQ72_12370 [Anaerolineae bacterium]|nr:hypothetical protein [Anaerolineae bacterium]
MESQHHPSTNTLELSEARVAYESALLHLEEALDLSDRPPVIVDPASITWAQAVRGALLLAPRAAGRAFSALTGAANREIGEALGDLKGRLVRFGQDQPAVLGGADLARRDDIRQRLLNVLWARDHVQEAIEHSEGATYETKRQTLAFVMRSETRLQRSGQLAVTTADISTAELRERQPTPPDPARWWWFLNYPRARRVRRMNTFWFILAFIPALASVVLITLLAQRLAINGPDLLSGASLIAQIGLGLGSIIAGRELLNELILRGTSGAWQGKLAFMLASLFMVVIVVFYFLAPPAAATIYNVFGQRAIRAGNAAEAELYLESAARLDPDPHAGALLEVGCLYQTLGAPDRAQTVFERVLEADSRLLLARFHLAQLYSDSGGPNQALQLLEDGLNLLDVGRDDIEGGDPNFLPNIDTLEETENIEYLLRLARGRAYLDANAPEQARTNLRDAEDLFATIADRVPPGTTTNVTSGHSDLACGPDDALEPFILSTDMNLHYYLARTYDALCGDEATVEAALEEWRLVRNGRPANSRQEAWRDDAIRRLSSGETCETNYGGLQGLLGSVNSQIPARGR